MRLKKWACVVVSLLSLSPLAAQQVVSTHSVSVELAGLMYAYECPLGDRFSLVARVGTQAGIQYLSSGSFWGEREHRWSVGLYPVLSVEPRYYYNLSKRYEAGKNTFKNSGAFLSCNLQYDFPPYYRHQVEDKGGFVVTPFHDRFQQRVGGSGLQREAGLSFLARPFVLPYTKMNRPPFPIGIRRPFAI